MTNGAERTALSIVLWIMFGLSVTATGFILLRACGALLMDISWNFCPAPPAVMSRDAERGAALRNLANDLERELAVRRLVCASNPKLPPPPLDLPMRADAQRPQQTALLKPRCPPMRPARLVMIFDTSGSMGLPMDANPDEMEEVERRWEAQDPSVARQVQALLAAPGRKRLDAARAAALELVNALPPGLETGLSSFTACSVHVDVAPTEDKKAVTAALHNLRAFGSTPLAAALRQAQSQMAGGPGGGRGQSVVVITDGTETCHGDPCAEAAELHRRLPELRVHIIDITGKSKLNCVATVTHGTITTATNVVALKAAIARTRAELERGAECSR